MTKLGRRKGKPIKPTPVEPQPLPVEPTPTPVEPQPTPVEPTPAPIEPQPSPVEPQPEPSDANAVHSDAFVDAIVVNAHLNWRTTAIWNSTAWRQPLVELGVRHIRTMIGTVKPARDDLKWLHDAAGVRACVLVSPFSSGSVTPLYDHARARVHVQFIRDEVGAEKVIAIEGPNEPNKDKTAGWEVRTREHQENVYSYVKGDPALRHIPVVAPSVYRRIPADFAALGDLSGAADVANLHYYTPGTRPTEGMLDKTQASVDEVMRVAQKMVPGGPLWVTEYGHQLRDAQSEWTMFHVSPLAAAKYGLRGMLEFFKRGVRCVAWYSLVDDYPGDSQHGLLAYSGTVQWEKRQTYHALKRLLAVMADPGPAFTPRGLDYRLSGDMVGVNHVLFQRRDGRYLLAIWQDAASWDRKAFRDANIPPRSVILELGRGATSVRAHHPTTGDDVALLGRGVSSVRLAVPDHVQIVEITP